MKVFTIPSWMLKLKETDIPLILCATLPRNYKNNSCYQTHEILWFTMSVRLDIDNLLQAMSILKILQVRNLH